MGFIGLSSFELEAGSERDLCNSALISIHGQDSVRHDVFSRGSCTQYQYICDGQAKQRNIIKL